MGRRRTLCTLAVAAAVLLSACAGTGHVEARFTYPPSPSAPPQPPPVEGPGALAPGAAAPPGIYFLHEKDAGLDDCAYVGERVTGGAAFGRPEAEQARARAFLDLAQQARWMGGNVVLLPDFREDFRSGRVLGRVYRCGPAQRRVIYQRAAARRELTVVPP